MKNSHTDNSTRIDPKIKNLVEKLNQHFDHYIFEFVESYTLYNQTVQVFSFNKSAHSPVRRKKHMLTFNFNPGDVLWNINNTTKQGIAELMRVHNRISKTTQFSQNLFHGRNFFKDQHARTPGRQPQKQHMHQTNIKNSTFPKSDVDGNMHESTFPTPKLTEKYKNRPSNIQNSSRSTAKKQSTPAAKKPLTLDELKNAFKDKGWIK